MWKTHYPQRTFRLTDIGAFKKVLYQRNSEQRWGRSSVWLERLPVTQKAASSSLVAPAIYSDAGNGILFFARIKS
jgi:hypothetical protein